MTDPHPAKFELKDASMCTHIKDETPETAVTHIDVEYPVIKAGVVADHWL